MATGTILKPDVFVKQVFEDVSPTLVPPALPCVVVGVNNQIVYKANAGLYDGTATVYPYPDLKVGAIVDQTSVLVYLTNEYGTFLVSDTDYSVDADSVNVEANIEITRPVVASVGTGETTATQTLNTSSKSDGITDAGARTFNSASSDFVAAGVKPGMLLFLNDGADIGIYTVEAVLSVTQVRVKTKKNFTVFTGDTTIFHRIIADYTQFVDDQADWLDEGVEPGMSVVIEDGSNSGTYRIEKIISDIELWINQIIINTNNTGVTAVSTTFTDSGKDFTAEGVEIGDQLVLEDGVDAGAWTVEAVGTTTLTLTAPFTSVNTGLFYHVTKKFVNSQNVNYRIDHTTEDMTGSTLINYTARRTDTINDLIEVQNTDELESQLGQPVPENPLAFGVWLALQNTDTTVYGTAIAEDEVDDHVEASEFLEAHEVYGIVPLSKNPAVHQVWAAHVTQQSDEESKHERIVFINRELFVTEDKLTSDTGAVDSIGTTFTDANVDFTTSEANPGDFIHILDVDNKVKANVRILRVEGPTEVELVAPGLTAYVSQTNLDYLVRTKPLDKHEQATFLADYATAFANRRVFMVWPDEIEVGYSDDTAGDDVFDTSDDEATALVPGYYQGCIISGMIANYAPQQPFTNLPMTGIVGLRKSNGYFTPFQLDTIATGGVYIIVQDVATAPVYSRHQLSTDVSIIEKRELSITKDVDYIAKFVRDTLRPYIGKYNITKVYLEMVASITQGLLRLLIEDGQLIAGEIVSLYQDEDQPDTVRLTIDLDVPYPANYIRVTLLI